MPSGLVSVSQDVRAARVVYKHPATMFMALRQKMCQPFLNYVMIFKTDYDVCVYEEFRCFHPRTYLRIVMADT
jgi:hypothetical protein